MTEFKLALGEYDISDPLKRPQRSRRWAFQNPKHDDGNAPGGAGSLLCRPPETGALSDASVACGGGWGLAIEKGASTMSIEQEGPEGQLGETASARGARTAIYVRTASMSHDSSSIDDQIAACSAEALKRGLNVVHVYSDPGCSGRSVVHHPGFLDMMKAAERGEFDGVVVSDADRFSRNPVVLSMVQLALSKLRVTVISVADGLIEAGPRSEAIVRRVMADAYRSYNANRRRRASAATRSKKNG